jgi:erythromycin esterase-like protein
MRAFLLAALLAPSLPALAQSPDPSVPARLVEAMRANAMPLTGAAGDYAAILRAAEGTRLVLIGEATHGTADFYRERARLTRLLIEERGFDGVAVEADWVEADRVDRWARLASSDATAEQALGDFQRFPRWVWRNVQVRDSVTWLRERNARLPEGERVGFHGIDMQNLEGSAAAVLRYLEGVDPVAAARAREADKCFEAAAALHGLLAAATPTGGCEEETASVLAEVRGRASAEQTDAQFSAERNALVTEAAERYGRLFDPAESWNVRDRFMMATIEALLGRYSRGGQPARLVVWAHNSHVGDARASELGGAGGKVTVGQLAREAYGRQSLLWE